MKKQTKKKILLAVDGSDFALKVVRYVSKAMPFQEMEVVLFDVHNKIPESYWDMERLASPAWRLKDVRAWERGSEEMLQEYMEKAKKILWRAGFPKDSVAVKIQKRKNGIARDIAGEAKRGYSCVAVGRKGMSKVKGLILGSVATKLIEKIAFVPLVVVGVNSKPGAILLALDGSENSMRTVDSVGSMLGGSDFEMTLIHVIRGEDKGYVKEAEKAVSRVFDEAERRLIRSGCEPGQITTKIIKGAHSRGGAIVEEAQKGGYGTIVVGRRGLSEVKAFSMGRVSNKVIHLAKEMAVWVVS